MSTEVTVRPATAADSRAWKNMRHALWPHQLADHTREIDRYFRGELRMPLEVLLAVDLSDRPLGFVELFIRPYAEGCTTLQVAFLEGWYVEPSSRRRGVGAALVRASEAWGRAQGCKEFASDALLDHTDDHAAHKALGFEEAARIVCFRKDL